MKNGEKFCFDFPGVTARIIKNDVGSAYIEVEKDDEWIADFDMSWWNAEYKEIPTNSTTKTGISNKSIIYKAKESKEIQEDLNKLSKLNEPATKNCESCEHHGSHDEVCNYCYKCSLWTEKEPTTKETIAGGKPLEQDIGKWIVKEESAYPCRGRMRCECDRCGYTKNAEYRNLAYVDAPKYIMPQFCEKCGNKKSNTIIYPTK